MRSTVIKLNLMASFVLAIFVSAPLVAQQDDSNAMVDMVLQIQQLQDEVRTLTGMIEDQSDEIQRLKDQQRDRYVELDKRITGMRGSSTGRMISSGAGSVTTSAAVQREDADVPDVRAPLSTASSVTALATPDTQAREFDATPMAQKEAYDQAFQSLKDRKFSAASQQFQAYLGQYPGSEYADNAQYWLGESYYGTRNYEFALEAFQGLMSKYPDSPKLSDCLLKIGFTHYELKQWEQARAALEQVEQQYAGSTNARLAGSRLRSMKREGHY